MATQTHITTRPRALSAILITALLGRAPIIARLFTNPTASGQEVAR